METRISLSSWLNFLIFCGLASGLCYATAAFVPLPDKISLLFAFAFGPFFLLASVALYNVIAVSKQSISLIAAALFNVVGTSLVTLMLVVQQTGFAFHDQFKLADRGAVTDEELKWMFREMNSVQLGIDLTWDLFISAGTFLFASAMWNHPVYGKLLAITGMAISALLLTFNMWYFPSPPGESGSIDFGPFVALWYMVITVWTWLRKKQFAGLVVGAHIVSQ